MDITQIFLLLLWLLQILHMFYSNRLPRVWLVLLGMMLSINLNLSQNLPPCSFSALGWLAFGDSGGSLKSKSIYDLI